jgi:hypothetical protein
MGVYLIGVYHRYASHGVHLMGCISWRLSRGRSRASHKEGRKEDGVASYKKDDLCQGRTAKACAKPQGASVRAPQACISCMCLMSWGVHLIGVYLSVYLIGVYLINVHLTGVYLMGVYLVGVHLISLCLIRVHLTGVHHGRVPQRASHKAWHTKR